jgi:two-component system cell cycle sensor histidine kinase PleC
MTAEARSRFALDDFADEVEPVSPQVRCRDLYRRFKGNPDLLAVPVVDGTRPLGLVHRGDFMMRLAHNYGNALYAKRSVTLLMDTDPLVVDRSVGLEAVQATIADSRPCALVKGFIITNGGRYSALGTALSLIRHSLALAEERSVALQQALAAAESASAAKSTFLATMSHELRTPLNAVIGFSELMAEQSVGPLSEQYVDFARSIREGGELLLSIVTDVLEFAKAERGEVTLSETSVNLAEETRAVVRLLSRQALRAGVFLDALASGGGVRIRADPRIVRQMLINLAGNGLKFTAPGGRVTLEAGYDAVGGPLLRVRDTGCGMDEDEIRLALEPFRQIDNGLNRKHEGTGLGLPLVKTFAEQHGGTLHIQSARGRGTIATVTFPRERALDVATRAAA